MAALSAPFFLSCGGRETLVGKWVQPVPGMPAMEQGFVLEEGGRAASVNMATLTYEAWEVEDGRLILSGKSVGNRQTISFSDTFNIEKLTSDSLVLRKGRLKMGYGREKSGVSGSPSRRVKGILTIGHEVRELELRGDTCSYWVVDKTGALFRQYDSITQGIKNGRPVYARLQVSDAENPGEGFAGNYDKVLHVVGIDDLAPCSRSLQIFKEGVRAESVNEGGSPVYILFGRDSLFADICNPDGTARDRLQRRTLPDGKHVWDIEDDDTQVLDFTDGCWRISRRGRLLFKQAQGDSNPDLGRMVEEYYAGVLLFAGASPAGCLLQVRHREYSGDGQFFMQIACGDTDSSREASRTLIGKRITLRGIPSNNDATVWQFVSDGGEPVFNFLYGADGQTLTLLDDDFEIIGTGSGATLEKTD